MAKILFNVVFTIIQTAVNFVMLPINAIADSLIPDVANIITKFNGLLDTYVGPMISWFANLLPPTAKSLILIYLTFLITYYTISYTVHGIVKVFTVIRKIKFW